MSKGHVEIDVQGTKRWYLNGKLHREGGPAIEYVNGDKSWYKYGKLVRWKIRTTEFGWVDKEWEIKEQK